MLNGFSGTCSNLSILALLLQITVLQSVRQLWVSAPTINDPFTCTCQTDLCIYHNFLTCCWQLVREEWSCGHLLAANKLVDRVCAGMFSSVAQMYRKLRNLTTWLCCFRYECIREVYSPSRVISGATHWQPWVSLQAVGCWCLSLPLFFI